MGSPEVAASLRSGSAACLLASRTAARSLTPAWSRNRFDRPHPLVLLLSPDGIRETPKLSYFSARFPSLIVKDRGLTVRSSLPMDRVLTVMVLESLRSRLQERQSVRATDAELLE